MAQDFDQITWDDRLKADLRELLGLAIREDCEPGGDWTTAALVPEGAIARGDVVVRQEGVIAGLPGAEMALELVDPRLRWSPEHEDGQPARPGDRIARIEGPAASLLTAERPVLNLLGRLSGIATLTRAYVEAVAGTKARIYDTRKTTPGWRRLEKYAVRAGGGCNHRTGLFDAVLIKDNHLALGAQSTGTDAKRWSAAARYTPAEAVTRARRFVQQRASGASDRRMIIEIEVDTLQQLKEVLPAGPDIVLLDNMSPAELAEAVECRNSVNPGVELEASGGVRLETIGRIASSGVDRISVGALTHSAVWLDVGMDIRGQFDLRPA
ncbi:MAG: carboxylating nicotinate-nucleotide diphosphorylase [Planctomycetota bacterium]